MESIRQYLAIETNYAVVINGKYGIGKTHFYKNVLSPKIRKIQLPHNGPKKFTPIHMSLFGIKDIDDVKFAILAELYPILKRRKVQLANGVVKTIFRAIFKGSGLGEIDKYIGDISAGAKGEIGYGELVLCFDDLDRKSKDLDIGEVFGFINNLVENEGAKVIIIANESELIKEGEEEKKEFYQWKEKVVGVSVQYKPDAIAVFDQIIENRYQSRHKTYYDFLVNHKADILIVIEQNEHNFRNLIFFLEHFKLIFNLLKKEFQEDKDFAVLEEKKLKAVLDFALPVVVEYKLGNFDESFSSDDQIEKQIMVKIYRKYGGEKHKKYENDSRVYMFNNVENKIFFFNSVFNYILGKEIFQIEELKQELKGYFVIEEGKLAKHMVVLEKLGVGFYSDWPVRVPNLLDEEYHNLTEEMLSYVDSGKYKLDYHTSIFRAATRFENLLDFDLNQLVKRFIKGINIGRENYLPTFPVGLSNWSVEQSNVNLLLYGSREVITAANEIGCFMNEVQKEIDEKATEEKKGDVGEKLAHLLEKGDVAQFIEKMKNIEPYEIYITSFWTKFGLTVVAPSLKQFENVYVWNLISYFKHFYFDYYDNRDENDRERISKEIEFVLEFRNFVSVMIENNQKGKLREIILKELAKSLELCEKALAKIEFLTPQEDNTNDYEI